MTTDLLAVYVEDHLTAATGGLELFRRAARNQADRPYGRALDALADEVAADRAALQQLKAAVGGRTHRTKLALGWLAEKTGRLKPNAHLLTRSPLSDLVELEGLRVAVQGKLAGWEVLRGVAETDPRLPAAMLDDLTARARDQAARLQELHREVGSQRLSGPD